MKQIRFVTKNWTLGVPVVVMMALMMPGGATLSAQAGNGTAGQKPAPSAPAPAKPTTPAPASPTTATPTAPAVPGSVQPKPVDVNTPQAPLPADYVIGP